MASVTLVQGVAAAAFSFTSQVAANDTVVIGDQTYTFVASPSSANDVDIGADLDASITNLAAAINDSGTEGTDYGTGTVANPYVTAVADTANDELDLTARVKGDQINGLHLAATSPGANDISAAAAFFSGVAGGTDGAGNLADWAGALETDGMQPNSQIIFELHQLTEAAD